MSLQESVLSFSTLHLFGKELRDLKLEVDRQSSGQLGKNTFIQKQLRAEEAKLARIYAFSFDGQLSELQRPTIFLVHGEGLLLGSPAPLGDSDESDLEKLSQRPEASAVTGIAKMLGSFADDISVWEYDRGDFTLRLEPITGTFEDVLMAPELAGPDMMANSSGMWARSSGMWARSSGMWARSPGAGRRPDLAE